ncbi:hypothetical protein COV82_01985 [Candidatus Peregrinibacteria bacterium CG11_big_fil_rev_8_21_14_0_20_46_8]|nr:MAG: hypothetical protein COV82_01985 [Candidatus Peregrinibacteria bacterium CG11_big_fil_rev_8_21_14_0_20_46_8]
MEARLDLLKSEVRAASTTQDTQVLDQIRELEEEIAAIEALIKSRKPEGPEPLEPWIEEAERAVERLESDWNRITDEMRS